MSAMSVFTCSSSVRHAGTATGAAAAAGTAAGAAMVEVDLDVEVSERVVLLIGRKDEMIQDMLNEKG